MPRSGGGQPVVLAEGKEWISGLTVDKTWVYAISGRVVLRVPRAGGAVEVLATTELSSPVSPRVDREGLLVADNARGQIVRLAPGAAPVPLATDLSYPNHLVVDGDDLYFTTRKHDKVSVQRLGLRSGKVELVGELDVHDVESMAGDRQDLFVAVQAKPVDAVYRVSKRGGVPVLVAPGPAQALVTVGDDLLYAGAYGIRRVAKTGGLPELVARNGREPLVADGASFYFGTDIRDRAVTTAPLPPPRRGLPGGTLLGVLPQDVEALALVAGTVVAAYYPRELVAIPTAGGAARPLPRAHERVYNIVVDGGTLFLAAEGMLERLDAGAHTPVKVLEHTLKRPFVVDAERIYLPFGNSVKSYDRAGGDERWVASRLPEQWGVVGQDAANLYVVVDGGISAVPKAGGDPVPIFSDPAVGGGRVLVDDEAVYVVVQRQLERVAKAGGPPRVLLALDKEEGEVIPLATDSTSVLVETGESHMLLRVPKGGGGITPMGSGVRVEHAAADDHGFYFSDGPVVWKVAR
jgi:hypothetical protein